jgi:predicted RNA polymerase sigma factor
MVQYAVLIFERETPGGVADVPPEVMQARMDLDERIAEQSGRVVAGMALEQTETATTAEEAVQDAYVRALRTWARDGVPDRPGAWLTTVARRNALNRAVAVSMVDGPQAALAEVEALERDGRLAGYRYLPATKADLLHRLGRDAEAFDAYKAALALSDNAAEQEFLSERVRSARIRPAVR